MKDSNDEWVEDGPDYRLEKGDLLFTSDELRTRFAQINNYGYTDYKQKSFFVLAQEFKEAADRVVESLETFTPSFNNYPTSPIIYLYRHYLELHLKHLMNEVNKKLGNPPINYDHKIHLYWQKLKPTLIEILKPDSYEVSEIEAVEECIMEFADIDPESMSFRYPFDKKGQPLLFDKPRLQNIKYIDLQHLAEKIAGIYGFFMQSDLLLLQYQNQAEANRIPTEAE